MTYTKIKEAYVIKAHPIITQKSELRNKGRIFEKIYFQLNISRNSQNLSKCAVTTQMHGFFKPESEIQAKIIIHKWKSFPDRNPMKICTIDQKKVYYSVVDDMEVLHKSQIENFEIYYKEMNQEFIQLVAQDWPQYSSKEKLISTERQRVEQMFKIWNRQDQPSTRNREKMSDQESVGAKINLIN